MMMKSVATRGSLTFLAGVLALSLNGVAQAQPDEGTPSYAVHQQSIAGTIRSLDGQWIVYVRARNGDLDRVQLHQGTIITPTGLTLEPGMQVTVYGHPGDGVFVADDIETPYRYIPNRYPAWQYPYPGWGFNMGWGWGWGGGDWDDWCCR
ncbi:MAG: hypothetical protein ACYC8W_10850 [Candidatus Tyrphobacter sp.]